MFHAESIQLGENVTFSYLRLAPVTCKFSVLLNVRFIFVLLQYMAL